MSRKNTQTPAFTKRIPRDIRDRMVGRTLTIPLGSETVDFRVTPSTQSVRFSLRTQHPAEARIRQAEAVSYVEQYFEWVRSGRIVELTHRQVTALAGEFYRAWSRGPDGPGSNLSSDARSGELLPAYIPEDEELQDELVKMEREVGDLAAKNLQALPAGKPLSDLGSVVDRLAQQHGFPQISEESRSKLLAAIVRELRLARETAARNLAGDYTPDPRLAQLPAVEREAGPTRSAAGVSLMGLVESWWTEARALGKTASTHESYANSFRMLAGFLGHDDARRVTPENIIAFKDHRLSSINEKTGKPTSAKTVKASDLTAFKSVFEWAVANRKLPSNPAQGVTLKLGKKTKLRERDFTDSEATALLRGASAVDVSANPRNSFKTRMAKRWVPWLCAYSGSRVGELVQLRKEDFRQEDGAWIMQLTPEAGTVKGKEFRDIPVHEHLVELGFIAFVRGAPSGYLFMDLKPGKSFLGVWQSKKNRLAEFARGFVPDPNVAPNHGWRHTFKSRGFEAGLPEKVLDALCGHAPASTGRSYGAVTLKTKIDAIARFPRYAIDSKEETAQ